MVMSKMRVGIPRGLLYHSYFPLWKTFFLDLGAEVVSSSKTNRKTVERGIESAVDEACFPIKVYYGHVRELCQQRIDYLFIPRLISTEYRSYICPKFMGLPDMIKAALPDLPPLIDITVDLSKNDRLLNKEILRVGKIFTNNKNQVLQAYQHGQSELHKCLKLCKAGYNLSEAIRIWEGEKLDLPASCNLSIGVIGHSYSLYDQTISMNIIERLRGMGCQVHLMETLDRAAIEKYATRVPKRVFWTLGRQNVGSALYMQEQSSIDGIIYLACFGCGPDSMIGEVIGSRLKEKPFMTITVDEHTGEAGMVTRLEAFCDMLRRRKVVAGEDYISAHG